MAQNRKPPAYQEYASELLANKHFRLMGLEERGLLFTLKLECWANGTVPSKSEALAKYLGVTSNDIDNAFNEHVKAFVAINEDYLRIPELDDYRNHLAEIRDKQSKGGKTGSRLTNQKLSRALVYKSSFTSGESFASSTGDLTSDLQHTRLDTNESLVKPSLEQLSQPQSLANSNYHDEWIDDYEKVNNKER
jgi:hypothetical protein